MTEELKCVALVIGVGDYQHLSKLKIAGFEAKHVYRQLRDNGIAENPILRHDQPNSTVSRHNDEPIAWVSAKADYNSLAGSITIFKEQLTQHSGKCWSFFYFSGHGIIGGDGDVYLLPNDARVDESYRRDSFPFEKEVLRCMRDHAVASLPVLDVCPHDLPAASAGRPPQPPELHTLSTAPLGGAFILTFRNGGKTGQKISSYTRELVQGLFEEEQPVLVAESRAAASIGRHEGRLLRQIAGGNIENALRRPLKDWGKLDRRQDARFQATTHGHCSRTSSSASTISTASRLSTSGRQPRPQSPISTEILKPSALRLSSNSKSLGVDVILDDPYTLQTLAPSPNPVAVLADHPAPASSLVHYFEVSIRHLGASAAIGVGYAPESHPRTFHVGWCSGSFGLHGRDGKTFCEGHGEPYDFEFGGGDVVGAALDFQRKEIFFTKNGQKGKSVAFEFDASSLYPTVSIHGAGGEEVCVNFGRQCFSFEVEPYKIRTGLPVRITSAGRVNGGGGGASCCGPGPHGRESSASITGTVERVDPGGEVLVRSTDGRRTFLCKPYEVLPRPDALSPFEVRSQVSFQSDSSSSTPLGVRPSGPLTSFVNSPGALSVGKSVTIRRVSAFEAQAAQSFHGGWAAPVKSLMGKDGVVEGLEPNGAVRIRLDDGSGSMVLHPSLVSLRISSSTASATPPQGSAETVAAQAQVQEAGAVPSELSAGGARAQLSSIATATAAPGDGVAAADPAPEAEAAPASPAAEMVEATSKLEAARVDAATTTTRIPQAGPPWILTANAAVTIRAVPISEARSAQKGHGGWSTAREQMLGKAGVVLSIEEDGDAWITMKDGSGICLLWNPSLLAFNGASPVAP